MTASRREESIKRFLKLLGMWERRDEPVGNFSKGMRQKTAIARALIHDPQLLFLDEPTSGLDPEMSKTLRDFILELKAEKRTIFLNTHNLDEAERICDKIGIIKGRLVTVGSPAELRGRMGKRRIAIQLRKVDDRLVSVVRSLDAVKGIELVKNSLICEVDNPENENPAIVEAIIEAGGSIQYITDLKHSLEDVYLNLIREETKQ